MLDLIVWDSDALERKRMIIAPDRVLSLQDVYIKQDLFISLSREMCKDNRQHVCLLSTTFGNFYVFHDAFQVAQAINRYQCMCRRSKSAFAPICPDTEEEE